MNPMTMIFAVCSIGVLLMCADCDSVKPARPPKPLIVHRFCRTRDIVRAYVRVCPRSLEEETVIRGVDDDEPFLSERALQSDANTEEEDEDGGSLFALLELLMRAELRKDDESLASAGEGWSGREMVGERRRRRSIRKNGPVFNLLKLCCKNGCTDKDIDDRLCALERLTP